MKSHGKRHGQWVWLVGLVWLGITPARAQTCTKICCVHHFKLIHGFLDQAVAAQQRAETQTPAEFGATYTRQTAITFLNLTAAELRKAGAHFALLHDAANQKAVLAMAQELTQAARGLQAAKTDAAALALWLHTDLKLKIPPAVAPAPAPGNIPAKTKTQEK